MRKFLLSLTLLCVTLGLMAQQRTIRGVVSDPDGPVPGANVLIKGTTTGVATDFDGNYEISVQEGAILQFSSVGLETKEVTVTSKTPAVLNLNLAAESTELDVFVVVGYGVQKKSDLTGSVSGISEDKLKEAVAVSVDQALQGRVTGVQVTQSSGQPGEASSVVIRGVSSLNGNSDPLYVVDGMPINNQGNTSSNPLASINPADIVSMEVLKDASATAIYGSRAANGVVMITTRKGKAGESRIAYEGNISVSQLPKKIDMMDLKDYSEYRLNTISIFGNPDANLQKSEFLGSGTDWQDELYRLAFSHNHQLSVSGGSETTTYAVSMGYGDQQGIVTNTDFQRFNGRINLETQAKKWLKVGTNMAYTHINKTSLSGNEDVDDEGLIIQTLLSLPSNPVKDLNGDYSGPQNDYGAKLNPIAAAVQSPVKRKEQNLLANIYTQVQFTKDLMWRTEFGVDYTRAEEEKFTPTYQYGAVSNERSSMSRLDANNFTWRASSFLNYNKQFNPKNSINAMVGAEATEWSYRGTTPAVIDLLSNNLQSLNQGTVDKIDEYKGSGSMASAFARFVYNYGDRYLLTATGRFDGSSNFSEENRWGFFPSFAFAWRIDQENFAKRSEAFQNVFSNLKLRLGYGQTGNSDATPAHLAYVSLQKNNDVTIVQQVNYTNPDLKWETNWQLNGGLDIGFINRINVTIDGFYKQNEDLLLQPSLPDFLGASTDGWAYPRSSYVNSGTIRNVGAEISINSQNIVRNKFTWETNFNFTYVKNKIVNTGVAKEPIKSAYNYLTVVQQPNRSEEGHAPGKFWGYKTDGVIKNTDQLNELERETGTQVGDINFVNTNGDNKINSDDMTWIGDPNPDFTAGLGNTFTYGPWSLTVYLTCSYGNDVFNMTKMQLEGQKSAWVNQTTEVKNFARVASETRTDASGNEYTYSWVINENTSIPRPTTDDENGNVGKISDRYVEDGSYIRIQNIALSYTLPARINQKLHINNLRVTANVQNVYTFTKYSGYDPEIVNRTKGITAQGVDTGRYPSPRIYSLGLNFEF